MPKNPAHPTTRRRAAVATALLSASALLASAPAASAGWAPGPAFTLPRVTFSTDFAAAPDGSATAIWVTQTGENSGVLQAQRVSPTGIPGPVQTLDAADPDTVADVATSADGDTVVAWTGMVDSSEPLPLRVAAIAPDGSAGPVRSATATGPNGAFDEQLRAGVDDAGNTTVAWTGDDLAGTGYGVNVVRFPAAGPATAPQLLSRTGADAAPIVAVAPGGTAWVAWTDDDLFEEAAWVARLAPDGTPGAPQQASFGDADGIGITAGSTGAVIAWSEFVNPTDPARLAGVRLPLDGDTLGAPLATPSELDADQESPVTPAIGPDGTVSLAWPRLVEAGGPIPTTEVALSRFAPDAETASTTTLATTDEASAALTQLGGAPDGSLLATWIEVDLGFEFSFHGARVAPDGTPSTPALARDVPVTFFPLGQMPFLQRYIPRADTLGGGLLGVVAGFPLPGIGGPSSLSTQLFDVTAPVVTAAVPASAVVGAPVAFSATATDRTAVRLSWDFGDESESRAAAPRHRYAEPGTYAVTLTAVDEAGNDTTVRRALTITPPPAPPAPPAPPRPAARAAAALKLTKAARSGAKVSLAGTIAPSASGRVTLVYTQRLGRRTVRASTTATIARGRWSTTLRLGRALARAPRRGATVTASYAGDADTAAASARRSVSTTKPKPAKKPKTRR